MIKTFNQFTKSINEEQTEIIDISDESVYPRKGEPIKSNNFFIIHHTAGLGDAHDVVHTLNVAKNKKGENIKLGVQWVVDRDGIIYKTLPSNSRGAHVGVSTGDRGAPPGISNSNAQGVEVIGKDDPDVLRHGKTNGDAQAIAVLKIIKHLGYTRDQIFGHGEVNPGKMADEGATIKQYVMDHWEDQLDLSVFDKETTGDIARPIAAGGTEKVATIDSDLITRLIVKLKEKNFSQADLDKFSQTTDNSQPIGNIHIINGKFDKIQKDNIALLTKSMTDKGITDPLTQIGILSVISKECNFKPKNEGSYAKTPNSSIREKFEERDGDASVREKFQNLRDAVDTEEERVVDTEEERVINVLDDLTDLELDELKSNPEDFFNWVYGGKWGAKHLGNVQPGDGYLYRGRGFNQLTGRSNYKKYGGLVGQLDLVGKPDLVNNPEVAANIAIVFLTKGKPASSFRTFTDKTDAAKFFADVNAGSGVSTHRDKAIEASANFNIA